MNGKREQDKQIIVRDTLLIAGVSLLTVGCSLYSLPLGLIVCGGVLTYLGIWHR